MCNIYVRDEWRFLFVFVEGGIKPKDRDYSIELDAEEKMLLNRILNKISVRLIETDVKFISIINIHFASAFELFHMASISIRFRRRIAR